METIRFVFGLDSMVPETKNFLIAPKISELNAPILPDISAARGYPLSAFVLNIDVSLILPNLKRQCCFNFIRNAEAAFEEYGEARAALLSFVENRGRSVEPYFHALRNFEHCLAHLYHATLSLNQLSTEKQFSAGDKSVLDRAAILHSHVKHMGEKYQQGSIRDEVSFHLVAKRSDGSGSIKFRAEDAANVPMWLTNDRIECRQAALTYLELSAEIEAFYDEALKIANLHPPNSASVAPP